MRWLIRDGGKGDGDGGREEGEWMLVRAIRPLKRPKRRAWPGVDFLC